MELKALRDGVQKWFDVPDTNVQVLLKLPSRKELMADSRSCMTKVKGEDVIDTNKWFTIVATNYILDAKGIKDEGKDVDYTTEVGFLLMSNQLIGGFIDRTLTNTAEWNELGK